MSTLTFLKSLGLAIIAIFLPIKSVIITAFVLCLVDMCLGVAGAYRQGRKITSKGLSRTIAKIVVYEVALLCGYLVQQYLLEDHLPIVNLMAGLIGVTEMKSVLENLDIIYGDKFFSSVIDILGSHSKKDSDHKDEEKK